MFGTARISRLIASLMAIALVLVAGIASAHGHTRVSAPVVAPVTAAVTGKVAPCHQAGKTTQDACKEICASGVPDYVLAAAPGPRTEFSGTTVVYRMIAEIKRRPAATTLPAAWHPPPGTAFPVVLRHQRLLI